MKRGLISLAVLCAFSQSAQATNWFELENNEPQGSTNTAHFWGFVQPELVHNEGGAVEGIVNPKPQLWNYNGQTSLNNLMGPTFTHQNGMQVFRARPGLRGVIPGTDGKANYFLLAEFGQNGITEVKESPNSWRYTPAITDATVSFDLKATRLRVGLGRLPLGEEAMQGEPAMNYANLTSVSDQLLNERFVDYYYTGRPEVPLFGVAMTQRTLTGLAGGANNLTCAQPGHCSAALNDKPVGAFRDMGIEAYDWINRGNWEYSYALMVSDGNGLQFADNGNYDISGRLQASYIFGGSGAFRQDASVYAWHQDGRRNFNGTDYTRIREGIGAQYKDHGLRIGGEYIKAAGMIYYGVIAPFLDVGAPAFEPVDQMALDSSNTADGYYLDVGYKFTPKWETEVRYDYLDKLKNSAYDERLFSTVTYGAQYFYSKNLRFLVNYEVRKISVANPMAYLNEPIAIRANAHTQLTDASIIAGSIGNRIDIACTYSF
jgi:hypothetical protein